MEAAALSDYRPRLVCFSCNFGWGYLAGPDVPTAEEAGRVRVACTGKVDALTILRAFKAGADGVLILGCLEGNCHFQDGNYQAGKMVLLIRRVLEAHGLEPERLRIVFSLDPEGRKISELIADMKTRIGRLGPVRLS